MRIRYVNTLMEYSGLITVTHYQFEMYASIIKWLISNTSMKLDLNSNAPGIYHSDNMLNRKYLHACI